MGDKEEDLWKRIEDVGLGKGFTFRSLILQLFLLQLFYKLIQYILNQINHSQDPDIFKFIISFSIFNRMGLWRTLCLQSNFEEVLCGFVVLHLFYLHFHSSNNPLRLNSNNKIPFFPF